jgi:hypothetical protein
MKILEHSPSIDLDEFMRRPLFAHLGTTEGAQSRVYPVWCLWKEGYMRKYSLNTLEKIGVNGRIGSSIFLRMRMGV